MTDSQTGRRSAAEYSMTGVSPFQPSGDGLRFEVLLDGRPPGERGGISPFLVLDDSEPYQRIILCRVADGAGNTMRMLSLKLRSDLSPPVLGGELVPAETNRTLEELWQREFEATMGSLREADG